MNNILHQSYKLQKKTWPRILILLTLLIFSICDTANAQFTEVFAGDLPAVQYGTVDWGDYDQDGDLDILLTGWDNSQYLTRIYENIGSGFTEAYPGSLTGVWAGAADWGDFDNDGDLDLILTGNTTSGYIAKIYENTGSGFFEVYAGSLTPVCYSSTDWGDYDNDGDLDLIITGNTGVGSTSKIYVNNGDGFTEDVTAGILGLTFASVSWGDYDNDGDLDILATGWDAAAFGKIYQNTGVGFVEVYAGQITGVYWGASEWGDYDNDGDLDIVSSGRNDLSNTISKIYKNTGSGFVEVFLGNIIGVHSWECQNNLAWGDYDNDGDLDLLVTGRNVADVKFSRIYRNNGSSFSEVFAGSLTPVAMSTVAWGDFNNDKKLDILLTGNSAGGVLITKLYLNECPVVNSKPTAPENCNTQASGTDVSLSWDKATDVETPQDGLSYNIYVVPAAGEGYIRTPLADTSALTDNGYRYVSSPGGIQYCESGYTLKNLEEGTYNWGVQAVDAGFLGGSFSQVNSFIIGTEINVLGNSVSIESGDVIPDFTDNTYFGETGMGEPVNVPFTIQNCGSYDIELSGNPRVSVIGDGFELILDAPQTISPGTTADFIISFNPDNCNLFTAEVNIANNDTDEGNYSFSISGLGIDNLAPDYPDLLPIFGECSAEVQIPQTNDNCSGIITGETADPLIYNTQGTFTINWSFTDAEDNVVIVPQTVTIEDVTNPEIVCPESQTLVLDLGENSYSIIGDEYDPLSISDNCEILSISNDFNGTSSLDGCDISIGLNTITWTVTDVGGNQSNCSFDLIVEESVGIGESESINPIIYPNPSDGKIFYDCSNVEIISIQIFDIAGRIIFEKRDVLSNGYLDITDFNSGIYIVNISTTMYFKSMTLVRK